MILVYISKFYLNNVQIDLAEFIIEKSFPGITSLSTIAYLKVKNIEQKQNQYIELYINGYDKIVWRHTF